MNQRHRRSLSGVKAPSLNKSEWRTIKTLVENRLEQDPYGDEEEHLKHLLTKVEYRLR